MNHEPTDMSSGARDAATRARLGALQSVYAPETLHRTVRALVSKAASADASRSRSRSWEWRLPAAGALAAVAIAALAIALSSHTTTPTVLQVARLGLAPATLPAPSVSSQDQAVLNRSAAGIVFPNWRPSLGWRATGARSDRLAGRAITTVSYLPATTVHGGAAQEGGYGRVGYAIVEGGALPLPAGASRTSHGILFRVLKTDGATVLTWRRSGHTCILVAREVPASTLIRLATWQ